MEEKILEILYFVQQNALTTQLELMEIYRNLFTWKVYLYKSIGGGW